MVRHAPWIRLALAVWCVALAACHTGSQDATPERSRLTFSQALPSLDGQHLSVKIVEVTYGPGGSSRPHRHPCAVIGYVIAGALKTQVLGAPQAVYRAGESFYEAPNGVHVVSANASDREPVRFLAYFTCDHDTLLSVPVPDTSAGGKSEP